MAKVICGEIEVGRAVPAGDVNAPPTWCASANVDGGVAGLSISLRVAVLLGEALAGLPGAQAQGKPATQYVVRNIR